MTFYNLEDIEQREFLPGFHVRFVHSEKMTLAFWEIDADSEMPLHSHPNEQITNILEGQLELTLGEEKRLLGPGSVVVIPPDVSHAGKAIRDCRLLDIFHPVREDYR